MKLGAVMFFTADSMQPAPLARLLEERGFESLWVPEHTHIPSTRKTPYPAGGPLTTPDAPTQPNIPVQPEVGDATFAPPPADRSVGEYVDDLQRRSDRPSEGTR